MIWSAIAEKGGPGKSTFISNLAVYLEEKGRKVLVLDFDSNRSLTTWFKLRKKQPLALYDIPVMHVSEHLPDEIIEQIDIDKFDDILMDIPGSDDETLREAARISDVCVMPTRDAGFDYMTVEQIIKALEKAHRIKNKRSRQDSFIFLNQVRHNSKLARGTKQNLTNKITNLVLLEQELTFLDDFKGAPMMGLGVIEYDEQGRGQYQFRSLMAEIFKTLERDNG